MKIRVVLKLVVYLAVLCGIALQSTAQINDASHIKTFSIQYSGIYQLQDSYTIIYDNTAEAAKLNSFQVFFYGPDRKAIAETQVQSFPIDGKIQTFFLTAPVIGFSDVEFSVVSLHSGEIENFPSNVGGILALNELSEVPEPEEQRDDTENAEGPSVVEEIKIDVSEEPPESIQESTQESIEPKEDEPSSPPSLSAEDKQRLLDTKTKVTELLKTLQEKSPAGTPDTLKDTNAHLDGLLGDINNLSDVASAEKQTDIKTKIDALGADILSKKQSPDDAQKRNELDALKSEILAQRSQLDELLSQNIEPEDATTLDNLDSIIEQLEARLTAINIPEAIGPNAIQAWDQQYLALKSQLDLALSPAFDWIVLVGLLVLAGLLLGLFLKTLMGGKAKAKPLKSTLNFTETPGIIFAASPMLAGNVAAPLAPAGQLAAAQLQMLSGPYSILKQAYLATGRIGYAQVGIPSAEDYAFGTGFLVSDRHVVTNRHVHGLYGHYLLDKSDPGGIEFIAEKGKDASDFVPFNGEPPQLLPELDIAIYTLARPVTNRTPIALKPMETEALDGRDVVVIGYPDTHTPEKAEVLAVVEDDPVFAVKRLSQGQIFRHSTDIDTPYGVETSVSESKTSAFLMPAICHNASTMGGNSGSPLLDIKNGQLLGVHFKGFKVFNQEEAANLAMAISQLTKSEQLNKLSSVTPITVKTDKIS